MGDKKEEVDLIPFFFNLEGQRDQIVIFPSGILHKSQCGKKYNGFDGDFLLLTCKKLFPALIAWENQCNLLHNWVSV